MLELHVQFFVQKGAIKTAQVENADSWGQRSERHLCTQTCQCSMTRMHVDHHRGMTNCTWCMLTLARGQWRANPPQGKRFLTQRHRKTTQGMESSQM